MKMKYKMCYKNTLLENKNIYKYFLLDTIYAC